MDYPESTYRFLEYYTKIKHAKIVALKIIENRRIPTI